MSQKCIICLRWPVPENETLCEDCFYADLGEEATPAATASPLGGPIQTLEEPIHSSPPCGMGPSDLDAGLGAEPSATWALDAVQSEAFATALLEPAEPNEALLAAAARYRAQNGMTVAELRTLLDGQPDDARVLVFDHFEPERTTTIGANCILSMGHNGPVAIICNQDEDA